MPKIDTKFLKEKVLPKNSTWKRVSKKKFDYGDGVTHCFNESLSDTVFLQGKLNWRKYFSEDSDEFQHYFVIDNGEEVLYKGEAALAPSNYYNWSIATSEDMTENSLVLILFQKGESENSVGDSFDQLYFDSIAGLPFALLNANVNYDLLTENELKLYFDDNVFDLNLGRDAFIDFLKKILSTIGFKYSDYLNEKGEDDIDELWNTPKIIEEMKRFKEIKESFKD